MTVGPEDAHELGQSPPPEVDHVVSAIAQTTRSPESSASGTSWRSASWNSRSLDARMLADRAEHAVTPRELR